MIQELKGLTFKQVNYIREVLRSLPITLDGMYDRMLSRIQSRFQTEALNLIKWLAYSERPLSLKELIETLRINPDEDGILNSKNSANEEEILDLLGGLVVIIPFSEDDTVSLVGDGDSTAGICGSTEDSESEASDGMESKYLGIDQVKPDESRQVNLAHFSIKEYLESERILDSYASMFHLKPGKEQKFLTHSCLSYLTAYANHRRKRTAIQDFDKFPLLYYTATTWYKHALLQEETDGHRESAFLGSTFMIETWNSIHLFRGPSMKLWKEPANLSPLEYGLFYATCLGLHYAAKKLIVSGANVNAQGGYYDNPLQVACRYSKMSLVKLLLENGANINAQGGYHGNALQVACVTRSLNMAKLLLENGANVNAQGGYYGNALQAACVTRSLNVAKLLLENGADVNAQGGRYVNALQAASTREHEEIVQLLLENGA